MADLDAELLALAGGDESSADERSPSPKPQSSSPPQHRLQRNSSSPADTSRRGTAKVTRKPRRTQADSDDNGEVSSSSSRQSLRSASMSESDSEGGTPAAGDDKPMFPYEKLYYSSRDKSEIDDMPEIKREEILADRAAQFERHQQDLALRRLLASREKEEAKAAEKKKRKAGAADLEDNQRKSSRQRTTLGGRKAGERNDAIEAYKKSRAEKGIRDEQRRRDVSDRKDRNGRGFPDNDLSDADAGGDSDMDWRERKDHRRSHSLPKDDPVAELVDIQRVKVGRDNFAQVCYNPKFEEAITDCYARICIGPSAKVPGMNDYRLARVKGFTTGRPYAITAPNGRLMPVETYVLAAHGKAEKPWTFLECSMSRFTEDEWRRYRITMANEDLKLPTKSFVNRKLQQINSLINHRFTDAEITAKIGRQQALIAKINRDEDRQPLEERRQTALAQGDDDAAQKYDEELRDILPMKLAMGTTLIKQEKSYVNKEQERLAELNRRNQRMNSENVRKAQVAEMRAKKKLGQRVRGIDDLFADGSDISRSGTPVNNRQAPGTSPAPPSHSRSPAPPPSLPTMPSTSTYDSSQNSTSASQQTTVPTTKIEEPGDPLQSSRSNTPILSNGGRASASNSNGNSNSNGSMLFKSISRQKDSNSNSKSLPVIKKALLEEEMKKQKVMDLGIDIEI